MRRDAPRETKVQILNNMFGPHADNLQRAMDRTTLRHGLLADNLANFNTPGYKRKDVSFGITLEQELQGRREADPIITETGSRRADQSSVDLEQEVVGLGETELRYQLLTEMTARYFSGLKNVIREGR